MNKIEIILYSYRHGENANPSNVNPSNVNPSNANPSNANPSNAGWVFFQ